MTTTHFTKPADARQFLFAAGGLWIGRAALRAIGEVADRYEDAPYVQGLGDADALRIANKLRAEMERRFPGLARAKTAK